MDFEKEDYLINLDELKARCLERLIEIDNDPSTEDIDVLSELTFCQKCIEMITQYGDDIGHRA